MVMPIRKIVYDKKQSKNSRKINMLSSADFGVKNRFAVKL
jgi:hypothetical protein